MLKELDKKSMRPMLEQIVITLRRVNQATSVYRAIALSEHPLNRIYEHIMETQYFTIIVDLNKIFDKSGYNLNKTIKSLRNFLDNSEYQEISDHSKIIENKYEEVLNKNHFLRKKIGAHLDKETIDKMYENTKDSNYEIGLCELQKVIEETIELFSSLSVLDKDLRTALKERIKPKDVMDILGLKPNHEIIEGILDSFFSIN